MRVDTHFMLATCQPWYMIVSFHLHAISILQTIILCHMRKLMTRKVVKATQVLRDGMKILISLCIFRFYSLNQCVVLLDPPPNGKKLAAEILFQGSQKSQRSEIMCQIYLCPKCLGHCLTRQELRFLSNCSTMQWNITSHMELNESAACRVLLLLAGK